MATMSINKDKRKQDKKFQKKSRVKGRYNAPDDDSDREVSNEDARVKKHTDIPDQFKQYIDEMHEYYQQQQAYLQEQNAKCFQQLFQIVCQGQQRQTTMPQLPGSYPHPYCLPQDCQPSGSSYPRPYAPPTGYNSNNPPSSQHPPQACAPPPPPSSQHPPQACAPPPPPSRQHPPQAYAPPPPLSSQHPPQAYAPPPPPSSQHPPQAYAPPPPPSRQHPPQGYPPPPPPSNHVLYEDVVNGTRVTVSESPHSGYSPLVNAPPCQQRPTFSANQRLDSSSSSFSLGRESSPQVNLFITVAPHTQATTDYPSPPQQPPPSSHAAQGQDKGGPAMYGLEGVGGDRNDEYVMPRRRSVRDALRERMKNRDRYRSRSWLDREGE